MSSPSHLPYTSPPNSNRFRSSSFASPSFTSIKITDSKHLPQQFYNGTSSVIAPLTSTTLPSSPMSFWQRQFSAFMFGLVNSILAIPGLYGYAAIIFRHPIFTPYLSELAKLVLWSSMIHQIVFTFASSLPFAIAQVQDAGLIFLSVMATNIVNQLTSHSYITYHGEKLTTPEIVSTTLVMLCICTALLGIVLIVIGKFKLATYVSYIPMPVIGGYLAFIGFFCFAAGVGMCINKPINTFMDFQEINELKDIVLILPGLIAGIVLVLISRFVTHFAALPCAMISLPIIFYIICFGTGHSLSDAQSYGWIADTSSTLTSAASTSGGASSTPSALSIFELYLHKIHIQDIWMQQFPTWLAMTIVVAFSACLDIAAIEMDMKKPLRINSELTLVGISNFVSGLFGGYTGSYIFSQTILTYRTKTNSRLVGMVVIVCELALFILPFSLMAYVPNFFFASTLIYIAIEIMYEWLVLIYFKILFREYFILFCTFIIINVTSIQTGMLMGLLIAIINFALHYSKSSQSCYLQINRSNVLRNVPDRYTLGK